MNRIDHREVLTTLANPHWKADMNFQTMNAQALALAKMTPEQLEAEENKIIKRGIERHICEQKLHGNKRLLKIYFDALKQLEERS